MHAVSTNQIADILHLTINPIIILYLYIYMLMSVHYDENNCKSKNINRVKVTVKIHNKTFIIF